MHACMYVCVCMQHACMNVCMSMHVYVCMRMYVYACMYVCQDWKLGIVWYSNGRKISLKIDILITQMGAEAGNWKKVKSENCF